MELEFGHFAGARVRARLGILTPDSSSSHFVYIPTKSCTYKSDISRSFSYK